MFPQPRAHRTPPSWGLTAGLVALVSSLVAAPVCGDAFDLLLIGDSITDGQVGHEPGFRDNLLTLLGAHPTHSFTMVGASGTAPHQGHFMGGKKIEEFYPGTFGNGWGTGTFDATPVLNTTTAEIAAIHLGTNDMSGPPPYVPYSTDHGQSLEATDTGELAEFIQYVLQWQDGTNGSDLQHVVLSIIIPAENRETDNADWTETTIAMAEDFAEGLVTGSPVRITLVDHYSHFIANPDLFTGNPGDWMDDSLHPNDTGYTEMAGVYHAAIVAAVDDATPPAAVGDLAADTVDSTSVTVSFTTTGDDGMTGQATWYDLRVSGATINAGNFGLADQVVGEPVPMPANNTDVIVVSGLLPGMSYDIALKVVDDAGNRSSISNVLSVTTTGTPTTILTLREGLNGFFGTGDNTMIDGSRSDENWGGATTISTGRTLSGADDTHRTLIRFDVSQVPDTATILDAKLRLYHHDANTTTPVDVAAYRVTKLWVEGTVTGPPTPQTGSSSWDDARRNQLAWSGAGASAASDAAQNDDPSFDRYATAEDTITMTAVGAWYEWDLTGTVAQWVTGAWNNDGVLLQATVENVNNRRTFRSSEYTGDPTLRPTLVVTFQTPTVGIGNPPATPPAASRLFAAYPNPFRSTTTIRYEVATPEHVRLRIYSVEGRLVRTLVDETRGAGAHTLTWNGAMNDGRAAATGVYFYRLDTTGANETRKLVLVR